MLFRLAKSMLRNGIFYATIASYCPLNGLIVILIAACTILFSR